jgi:hypothetical protein
MTRRIIAVFDKTRRIVTAFEWPPTPYPPFWRAWDDDLGADASPYGQGETEAEAIADLMAQLEDRR